MRQQTLVVDAAIQAGTCNFIVNRFKKKELLKLSTKLYEPRMLHSVIWNKWSFAKVAILTIIRN